MPELPGSLDVLVHSAGVEQGTRIADTPRDVWEQVFATNVFAVAELTRLALPALRAARGIGADQQRVRVHRRPGRRRVRGVEVRAPGLRGRPARRGTGERRPGLERAPRPDRLGHAGALTEKLGEDYDTAYYLAPEDVAAAVRTVVDLPERGTIESLAIRPTRKR